ncbi:glycerophosphodiester phosphodiesterase [Cellvibrio sp. KY-GH-1]|uniref:glycerophosphodiester phosphodiesterase family protein n=1 Tax=Cellvibrio sp. KY-GH-1 TaxID=2303332 RepID=UPI001248BE14|nr:glycerophosphodiester phosphodiesterase family protein [Cellvibrio sp. KY-GH-1]QEY17953.1 glycerophosphodiester phosphodiesterase [Cellvibrio sp. KY-GH-1]
MFNPLHLLASAALVLLIPLTAAAHSDRGESYAKGDNNSASVQLGPRPFYLVNDMDESSLKKKLQSCANGPFKKTNFSIGHRGAPLQFPEHTKESYEAAAKMGAGILECDVAFTKDKQLVCRHSQCDLHTTTNILATSLASKCSQNFSPFDPVSGKAASATCCTSDITLAEFKSLQGKMDAFNPKATTVDEYLKGTANWRTDLYASKGTLLSHKESIELFKKLGVKMTPELKTASVPMPYNGYTQAMYAQQLIDEYKAAGVKARDVWPQSFDIQDIRYWIQNEPEFGKQAVYLDDADVPADVPTAAELQMYADQGFKIVAPPIWVLLALDKDNKIVASDYARNAKKAGLKIITWSFERSGPLKNGGGWYYQSVNPAINNDGDMMVALDVLAKDVGVIGIFSDWPASVSYYANCMNLK